MILSVRFNKHIWFIDFWLFHEMYLQARCNCIQASIYLHKIMELYAWLELCCVCYTLLPGPFY